MAGMASKSCDKISNQCGDPQHDLRCVLLTKPAECDKNNYIYMHTHRTVPGNKKQLLRIAGALTTPPEVHEKINN